MPVTTYYMGTRRRLATTAGEGAPGVARMLEELNTTEDVPVPDTDGNALVVVQHEGSPEKDEAASFFAEAAELPFAHGVARGNLCAFISGRADEADLCKVTVTSILSFNPGMRVAVAAEDAGLSDFER